MQNRYYIQNSIAINDYCNDDGKFLVKGYACHFNRCNLNREIVDADSFANAIDGFNKGLQNVVVNYNHDNDKIIGGVDSMTSDDSGLYITAHLNTSIPYVNDYVIPNIISRDLRAFSTEGYVTYDSIREYKDGTYYVGDFQLYAVAIVSNPADQLAQFSVANSIRNSEESVIIKPKYYCFF